MITARRRRTSTQLSDRESRLSASDPLPLQAELDVAAKPLPRQMPLFGPVHGPPLPRVDHESSLQAKVGLYRTLFAGRSDVYAYRWENTAEGTKGWAPKRRPGTTRDNPEYLPLTDEVISAHLLQMLAQGRQRLRRKRFGPLFVT